jgi:hypothetical protein
MNDSHAGVAAGKPLEILILGEPTRSNTEDKGISLLISELAIILELSPNNAFAGALTTVEWRPLVTHGMAGYQEDFADPLLTPLRPAGVIWAKRPPVYI